MSRCRSCGKPIEWIKTETGKNMPVNQKRITVVLDDGSVRTGRESHFVTCPQASSWRGHGKGGSA